MTQHRAHTLVRRQRRSPRARTRARTAPRGSHCIPTLEQKLCAFRLQVARRSHPGMDSPEGVAFRERLLAAAGAFLRVRAPAVNAQLCQVWPAHPAAALWAARSGAVHQQ